MGNTTKRKAFATIPIYLFGILRRAMLAPKARKLAWLNVWRKTYRFFRIEQELQDEKYVSYVCPAAKFCSLLIGDNPRQAFFLSFPPRAYSQRKNNPNKGKYYRSQILDFQQTLLPTAFHAMYPLAQFSTGVLSSRRGHVNAPSASLLPTS